jgi:hypothetical protein
MLPQIDVDHLNERAPGFLIETDGSMTCILIPNFPLGPGFERANADLLLRLSPGYPDVPPDMWWFSPPVRRTDGAEIPATQARERHLGREWQRWSRHLSPGQWHSGIDSVESYLSLVRRELACAASCAAA